jgi:hypothetical protein
MHEQQNEFFATVEPQDLADAAWTPPYDYGNALDLVDSVPNVVDPCVGVGKI